jgi:hypothetical protein
LYLNPDTIVPEDCFIKCLDFFQQYPDAGALGVRMLDGNGSFLPESKRSFPSPVISFYKLSGLTRLFPRSKTFGKYHLGSSQKGKQVYFIKHMGANVNLGNIAENEVIPLECLRRGLRGDTFFQFLPEEIADQLKP